MKSIGDSTEFWVTRNESGFDRACDAALSLAWAYFEIDADGHSRRVKDWKRSENSIKIEFITYQAQFGYLGTQHLYQFRATAV